MSPNQKMCKSQISNIKSADIYDNLELRISNFTSNEHTISTDQMMISKTEDEYSIALQRGTRVLLFGGESLPEERFLLWNFVSHSKERLKQAAADWKAKKFPKIEGDDTYIPMPEMKFRSK